LKKLRVLTVSFDTSIEPFQIPAFRGAIAAKVGLEHEWFHNHNNAGMAQLPKDVSDYNGQGQYHNRYPLIQYKISAHRQQKRPMLMCLDECVEEAHKFFAKPDWTINLNGEIRTLSIANLNVNQFNLQLWDTTFYYKIYRWQALNTDNWKAYQQLEGRVAQLQFLERILEGHIRGFMQGIGWKTVDYPTATILEVIQEKWISYKGVKVKCFDLQFKTNAFIPEFVGLGKGAAKGLGVVRRRQKRSNA